MLVAGWALSVMHRQPTTTTQRYAQLSDQVVVHADCGEADCGGYPMLPTNRRFAFVLHMGTRTT